MNGVGDLLALGRDAPDVGIGQMVLRTVVIYAFTLIVVRVSSSRFLSQATTFDLIVGILLGSVMSRAINGSAPFVPTLAAGAALLGMHWVLAIVALHTKWFGPLVKGTRIKLIEDGQILSDGLRRADMTSHDLAQALRLQAKQNDPSKIRRAYMERNGRISVIPYRTGPRVVDVSVQEGVQTVRIELG
jgi:uncharacterized membrane protein YcaP (DUF421 family)